MDKAKLFERHLETVEVDVPPYGVFTVRPLTRKEAMDLDKADGVLDIERKMVSWACVDPDLTYQDVAKWQENSSAMVMEELTQTIARISGMLGEASKEATTRFPDGSGE